MPKYIFVNDYTGYNRFKSNSEYRIFRAGEIVVGEPYAANPQLPKKIRERSAESVVVGGKFIVPSEFLKLYENRNNADGQYAAKLPKEKMINLNGNTMGNFNKGGVVAGAAIGIVAGVIFAFVTKKSKFFFGAIGMVGGAGIGYMLSSAPASSGTTTPSTSRYGTVQAAPKDIGGVKPTMSGS